MEGEDAKLVVPAEGDDEDYEQIYGQKQTSEEGTTSAGDQQEGGDEGGEFDIYDEDDDEDIPNIILDPDRVEGQGTTATPQSAARAGSGIRVSGGGVGRVNMTWSKADGSKPKPKPKKNPFEIDIEGLEDKPWRKPNVDPTDYFNYGFTEETWKAYCQKQVQLRMEQSMQGKIRVWEGGGKSDQKFPDIPAELLGNEPMMKPEHQGDRPPFLSKPPDFMQRPRPVQTFEGFEQQRHRPRGREQDDSVIQILSGDNPESEGDAPQMPADPHDEEMFGMGEQDPSMPFPGPGMPPRDFRGQPRPGFYGKDNFQNFRGPYPPYRGPFPPRFPPGPGGGYPPGGPPFRDRRDDRMGGPPRFGGRGGERDRPYPGGPPPGEPYGDYRVDRSPGRDDRPERPKEDSDSRGDSGRTSSSSRARDKERDRDRDRARDVKRDDKKPEKRRRSSERDTKGQKEEPAKGGSTASTDRNAPKDESRSSREGRSDKNADSSSSSRRRESSSQSHDSKPDENASKKRSRSKEPPKREGEEDRKRRR